MYVTEVTSPRHNAITLPYYVTIIKFDLIGEREGKRGKRSIVDED
jgi:hypothetical protein